MLMKRIIKLLPIAAVLCVGAVSCDKDDNDDSSPSVVLEKQPNGDYAVDLGLPSGLKWATCNVGAEKPEEFGDYFAWGDTTTKYQPGYAQSDDKSTVWKNGMWDGYSWVNYRFSNETKNSLFKYCNDSDYGYDGITDTLTILTPVDDVAHYKWGGNWRMPTEAEFQELLDNCNYKVTTKNGVKGLKVTSRKDSSKSIFLPAAGFRGDTNLKLLGSSGFYWSSSLGTKPSSAIYLIFDFTYNLKGDSRYYGQSVRPVCP